MIGRIIEEHVRAVSRALFALEVQLGQLNERIGAARADELRTRAYALRVELANIGDHARFELNASAPEPSAAAGDASKEGT